MRTSPSGVILSPYETHAKTDTSPSPGYALTPVKSSCASATPACLNGIFSTLCTPRSYTVATTKPRVDCCNLTGYSTTFVSFAANVSSFVSECTTAASYGTSPANCCHCNGTVLTWSVGFTSTADITAGVSISISCTSSGKSYGASLIVILERSNVSGVTTSVSPATVNDASDPVPEYDNPSTATVYVVS